MLPLRYLAALFICLISSTTHAGEISGRVVGVADGDTITILTSAKEQVKIRLHGIDAPERGQDFGTRAKQALSDLVFGKQVRIETEGKDRYGRVIVTVFVGDTDVNLALVEKGLAWHYVKYSDSRELAQAQEAARAAQIGLWSHATPVPPGSIESVESRLKRLLRATSATGSTQAQASAITAPATCSRTRNEVGSVSRLMAGLVVFVEGDAAG